MTALVPFGPEIWVAEGPVVSFFGFPYPTRMAVIRLGGGSLFLWSPIALTDELRKGIDALGPVAHLVSPNKIHHLFLGPWKAAYPLALLYASPGLPPRRRDLAFDAMLGDSPEPAWANDIDQVAMRGSFALTEIVFFHRLSRTAIFADLVQNFPPGWFKGWRGILARLDGITTVDPGAPREWRASFWNRTAARQALDTILGWEPEQVFFPHGEVVRHDGKAFLRRAFRWLLRAHG